MVIEKELLEMANRASIKIVAEEESLSFRHELKWNDSAIFGIVILFCGGIFLGVVPFIKTSDTFSKVGGILIGSLFIVASVMTLIKITKDHFSISGNHIAFRYNLRSSLLVANGNLKAKMRVHAIRSRRSKFIIVSHYLQAPDKEFIIFRYQMKQSEESEARKLGNAMTELLNGRL